MSAQGESDAELGSNNGFVRLLTHLLMLDLSVDGSAGVIQADRVIRQRARDANDSLRIRSVTHK